MVHALFGLPPSAAGTGKAAACPRFAGMRKGWIRARDKL
jgi:hypothetical protein